MHACTGYDTWCGAVTANCGSRGFGDAYGFAGSTIVGFVGYGEDMHGLQSVIVEYFLGFSLCVFV